MLDRGDRAAASGAAQDVGDVPTGAPGPGPARPFVLQWRSAVLNSPTDTTCKLVLLVLAEFADAAGGNCWPSIASISELAGTNERTARRALDRATRDGWIERAARAVRGQAWRLYHYQLTLPEGAGTESARSRKGAGAESARSRKGAGAESGPFDKTCGLSRPKVRTLTTEGAGTESDDLAIELGTATREEQEQEQEHPGACAPVVDAALPVSSSGLSICKRTSGKTPGNVSKAYPAADRFLEFMSIYPRKENKAKALKVWQAKNLDAIADQIIAAVTARAAGDPGWSDPRYVPHPTTYLNGTRWEDQWSPAAPRADTSVVGRIEQSIRERRNHEMAAHWAANSNFHGKTYVGTRVEELPASIRGAVEDELRKNRFEVTDVEADAANRYGISAK